MWTKIELTLEQTQQGVSDEVLNFKKDEYTSFQEQEKYEHVGPKVTSSQDGKRSQDDDKILCLADDLKEAQDHIQDKLKGTSSSLKSKDRYAYHKFDRGLKKPPTDALRPIILDNACILCITAATGTELADAYSPYTVIASSPGKEVYDPWAFYLHATLLRQAFAHCGKFPTVASRRSLAVSQS
ncbi:hypothetical protein Tco_0385746 [Tanacetum coccineum]